MAQITPTKATVNGIDPDTGGTAAAAGGDTYPNNRSTFAYVKNANVSVSRTVTIGGVVDVAVTIPASSTRVIAADPSRYNDQNGEVRLSYDNNADLTIKVITLP